MKTLSVATRSQSIPKAGRGFIESPIGKEAEEEPPSRTATIRNLEEENVLEKELDSCFDAEYILSIFSDPNGKDITIPVILLNEHLKKKKEFIDVNIFSSWSAINGDISECEAWLFLNIDFGDLGIMKF